MRRSVKYSSACTSSMATTLPSAGANDQHFHQCCIDSFRNTKKRNNEHQQAKCSYKNKPAQSGKMKTKK